MPIHQPQDYSISRAGDLSVLTGLTDSGTLVGVSAGALGPDSVSTTSSSTLGPRSGLRAGPSGRAIPPQAAPRLRGGAFEPRPSGPSALAWLLESTPSSGARPHALTYQQQGYSSSPGSRPACSSRCPSIRSRASGARQHHLQDGAGHAWRGSRAGTLGSCRAARIGAGYALSAGRRAAHFSYRLTLLPHSRVSARLHQPPGLHHAPPGHWACLITYHLQAHGERKTPRVCHPHGWPASPGRALRFHLSAFGRVIRPQRPVGRPGRPSVRGWPRHWTAAAVADSRALGP